VTSPPTATTMRQRGVAEHVRRRAAREQHATASWMYVPVHALLQRTASELRRGRSFARGWRRPREVEGCSTSGPMAQGRQRTVLHVEQLSVTCRKSSGDDETLHVEAAEADESVDNSFDHRRHFPAARSAKGGEWRWRRTKS
jgi:hypothetical protein